ncbi:aldehyde dehydrogenase [Corynebacterium sp. LK2510]|uniref:aldehyde dehydrogenase n=1 Tax=Corynebacterium sp. LK2510 TaxID=3110472 RepID=UPI0034CF1899
MSESEHLTLAGDVTSALTHFAAFGLMIVIQEECEHARALFWFTEEPSPRAVLHLDGCNRMEVAEAVGRVARRWAADNSWVQETVSYPSGNGNAEERSPFSPRIKAFTDPQTWQKHSAFRHGHIDALAGDGVARRLIAGLGEAAYWRAESNSARPDEGASRWEMKTRNKGQEFIVHRLAPLVSEVASWSVDDILDGIEGKCLRDAIGKMAPDSRTSTGLTTPQPVDNALALIALLGMGMMPPVVRLRGIAVTPGAYPNTVTHPQWMVLPVPVCPVTAERFHGVVLSSQFDQVTRSILGFEEEKSGLDTAGRAWMISRNLPAVAVFPILKTGSSSAPERQVLNGNLVVL